MEEGQRQPLLNSSSHASYDSVSRSPAGNKPTESQLHQAQPPSATPQPPSPSPPPPPPLEGIPPAPVPAPQPHNVCSMVTSLFNGVFYFFCLLSGQYIVKAKPQCNWKSLALLGFAMAGLYVFTLQFCANVLSLVFDFYIVVFCPYANCSYFYHSAHAGNSSEGSGNGILSADSGTLPIHVNWNNAVITTATFAGWISYLLMTFLILIPIHSNLSACFRFTRAPQNLIEGHHVTKLCDTLLKVFCTTLRRTFKHGDTLSPFDDSESKDTSTSLSPIQAVYFHFVYIVNLMLYFTNLGLLAVIMHNRISTTGSQVQYYLDTSGLIFQMSSQFCAVHSCFIFSKVAYMVSSQQEQLVKEFDCVDIRNIAVVTQQDNNLHHYLEENDKLRPLLLSQDMNDRNLGRYYLLQTIDQSFIRRVRASLDPYGMWFSIHWVLYTLTTLLSCAFFAERVVKIFYEHDTPLYKLNNREIFDLSYITVFTLEHMLLFLYPCFRAASITVAREKMIQSVSGKQWLHIPLLVRGHFIQYLRAQNFSFRVSIFCADIQFSFNTAYLSLFVGIFGGILKLSI